VVTSRAERGSDFDGLVKDWQANGGEGIRKEYMDCIAGSA